MKETFFWTFSSDAISTLSDLTSEGFEVDWTVRSSSDAMTSGFVIKGEISGMSSLQNLEMLTPLFIS